MSFWDSKLVKDVERTGKLPVIETSFVWEDNNFRDCLVGIFLLAMAIVVVNQLVKKIL